jgi:putative intracellular protease/amidase
MNVIAVLFEGFETLDMFGPVEMLGASGEFEVRFFSPEGGVVTSYQGVPVLTERLDAVNAPEVLLLPGGMGVYTMLEDDAFITRIAELAKKARYVLSVCNGAFIYAKAGVLNGKRATTFKGRIDKAEAEEHEMPLYSVAVVNPGESFLRIGDNWVDWSHYQKGDEFKASAVYSDPIYGEFDTIVDNFAIKAFAVPVA